MKSFDLFAMLTSFLTPDVLACVGRVTTRPVVTDKRTGPVWAGSTIVLPDASMDRWHESDDDYSPGWGSEQASLGRLVALAPFHSEGRPMAKALDADEVMMIAKACGWVLTAPTVAETKPEAEVKPVGVPAPMRATEAPKASAKPRGRPKNVKPTDEVKPADETKLARPASDHSGAWAFKRPALRGSRKV